LAKYAEGMTRFPVPVVGISIAVLGTCAFPDCKFAGGATATPSRVTVSVYLGAWWMSAFSAMVTAPTGAEAGGEVVKNGVESVSKPVLS